MSRLTDIERMIEFVCAAVLVSGCLHNPYGWRGLHDSEAMAIQSARDEWQAQDIAPDWGESCDVLDRGRVRITPLPRETLQDACHAFLGEVSACVGVVNRHAFDVGGVTWIRISEDLQQQAHHQTIIHEAMHVLYGCGFGHVDRWHEDERVWIGSGTEPPFPLERAALYRYDRYRDREDAE